MEELTFGEQVKIVLGRKGMTIKALAREIEEKTGRKMSRQNLTQRLGRDNFQEQDMRMIAEILGCPFHLSILSGEEPLAQAAVQKSREKKPARTAAKEEAKPAVERDMTVGEFVDLHRRLDELEREKQAAEMEAAEKAAAEKAAAEKAAAEKAAAEKAAAEKETAEKDAVEKAAAEKAAAEKKAAENAGGMSAATVQERAEGFSDSQPSPAAETGETVQIHTEEDLGLAGQAQAADSRGAEPESRTPEVNAPHIEVILKESKPERPSGSAVRDGQKNMLRERKTTSAAASAAQEPGEEPAGEINPYTGREYETDSVRSHPSRIGYVQVYDRSIHGWTDMTEWAFLGYQERKKALLGRDYKPPVYLD